MNVGRAFEDRAGGVGRNVEQIFVENRNFFEKNRLDAGNLNAGVLAIVPKRSGVGRFVESRLQGDVGGAGEQDCRGSKNYDCGPEL